MSASPRIAVAMSGGVDSSVAAALLSEAGVQVFGLMLRLQDGNEGQPNGCCAPEDVAAARSVAGTLGFPFYVVDAREAFEQRVISAFVRGYAQGLTPNPCVECNRTIRWGLLLEHARAMGATHLATGHYARTEHDGTAYRLRAARDTAKDQSYVLHVLTQSQLAQTVFPLGELTKAQVRAHAQRMQLAAAHRPESQDLCFVQGDYRAFVAARGISSHPGAIVDRKGNALGTHSGLSNYTLGQRKGLRVPASEALFVLEKDLARNALIVGGRKDVGRRQFSVNQVNWIAGAPPAEEFDAGVQVRYHAPRVIGRITCTSPTDVCVHLTARHPDVAPGQSAVFYLHDFCLGGGIITP
jgi:tRNA-uridine 2-sulfurtransferase